MQPVATSVIIVLVQFGLELCLWIVALHVVLVAVGAQLTFMDVLMSLGLPADAATHALRLRQMSIVVTPVIVDRRPVRSSSRKGALMLIVILKMTIQAHLLALVVPTTRWCFALCKSRAY